MGPSLARDAPGPAEITAVSRPSILRFPSDLNDRFREKQTFDYHFASQRKSRTHPARLSQWSLMARSPVTGDSTKTDAKVRLIHPVLYLQSKARA